MSSTYIIYLISDNKEYRQCYRYNFQAQNTALSSMFLLVWQILYIKDFILLPFFLIIWFLVFYFYKNRKYKNHLIKKYFLPALGLRFLGAILTAFMYQYYYGDGDTYFYFFGARDIYNTLLNNPITAYEILTVDFYQWSLDAYNSVTLRGFFSHPKEAMVIRLAGLVSPLGLGSYIGTSFALTVFSFLGCWALYRVFYDIAPHLHWHLALAILFLPSMWFWSTGIMKDSIVMGALGFFVNGIYYSIISKRKKILRSIFFIIMGTYLMLGIKVYVLAAIFPATVVWVFFMIKESIKNPTLRRIATPLFFGIGALGALVVIQQLGTVFAQYTLEGFMEEASKMQWWLQLSTERDNGTGYTLGELDPSAWGLIKTFPKAVNVALFRPYPWEARKIIVIPSAIEALFTLGLTLYVLFKVGFFRTFISILGDPVILFCLIFAIIFAFAVGFTSYNFGALARYKIPCLPFYYVAMILLLDKIPKPRKGIAHQTQQQSKQLQTV